MTEDQAKPTIYVRSGKLPRSHLCNVCFFPLDEGTEVLSCEPEPNTENGGAAICLDCARAVARFVHDSEMS